MALSEVQIWTWHVHWSLFQCHRRRCSRIRACRMHHDAPIAMSSCEFASIPRTTNRVSPLCSSWTDRTRWVVRKSSIMHAHACPAVCEPEAENIVLRVPRTIASVAPSPSPWRILGLASPVFSSDEFPWCAILSAGRVGRTVCQYASSPCAPSRARAFAPLGRTFCACREPKKSCRLCN